MSIAIQVAVIDRRFSNILFLLMETAIESVFFVYLKATYTSLQFQVSFRLRTTILHKFSGEEVWLELITVI